MNNRGSILACLFLTSFLFACGAGAGSSSSSSPSASATEQVPEPVFQLTTSTAKFTINWAQFGDFHINSLFKIVYMGPHMNDLTLPALSHGFTHLITQSTPNAVMGNVPPSKRAIMWGLPGGPGVPYVGTQPWAVAWMPFNNDMTAYHNFWSNENLKALANYYPDTVGDEVPNCDLLCSDGEKLFLSDAEILASKNSPYTPGALQQLTDAQYIDAYKKAMASLYNAGHDYAKAKGYQGIQTAYGEPPIRRQTWQIPYKSWQEWSTNPNLELSNYLLGDYNSSSPTWHQQHGPYYNNCDMLSPSAYYFNDYPDHKSDNPTQWAGAGNYLAYLLFQVEVNRCYSDKDIIEWVYLRYHPSSTTPGKFIRDHMAEATAIFPFFAGAKGIWLYEYFPGTYGAGDPNIVYSTYEYFVYGLYRLSKFNYMFDGNYTTYMPTNPRDLLFEKKPVWRGVINQAQTKMLVAAQNPYADVTDTTHIDITYQGNSLGSIDLKGLETALVLFDLP